MSLRCVQGFLPDDIEAYQYSAGQHEGACPEQGHQIARQANAGPHQADGVDLALEGDAFTTELVADPWPELRVMDQPVVKARRTAGKAGCRQKQERGGGQYRKEYPQHPQRNAEPADGQQQVAHRRLSGGVA